MMQQQLTSKRRLALYMAARMAVISINSDEEDRVMRSIAARAEKDGADLWTWSCLSGLRPGQIGDKLLVKNDNGVIPHKAPKPEQTMDVLEALRYIRAWRWNTSEKDQSGKIVKPNDRPAVFVFLDGGETVNGHNGRPDSAARVRAVREVAAAFKESQHTLVFLQPYAAICRDLQKVVSVIDWDLPTPAELSGIVDEMALSAGLDPHAINGARENIVNALRGLTSIEAQNALAMALAANDMRLDSSAVKWITEEKRRIISTSRAPGLTWGSVRYNAADMGGNAALVQHLRRQLSRFSSEAQEYGGITCTPSDVLFGVQGSGKTFAAEVAAAEADIPLLIWNPSESEGRYVGDTARDTAIVLKTVVALAPAIFLIDEGGKTLARGDDQNAHETKRGQLAQLLTWKQELSAPVYTILTTNEAEIDPALMRRMDTVWFVDLPSSEARADIARIHLARRRRNPGDFDLAAIAAETAGYSGAEIEKVVGDALLAAFSERRALTTADVLAAKRRVVPVSRTAASYIARMRRTGQAMGARHAEYGDEWPEDQQQAEQENDGSRKIGRLADDED